MCSGIEMVKSSRKVSLIYRDTEIPEVDVSSFEVELNLRFAAAIKTLAIMQKLLSPLACEAMMNIGDPDDLPAEAEKLDPLLVCQVACQNLLLKTTHTQVLKPTFCTPHPL